jgi:hypothetical protein
MQGHPPIHHDEGASCSWKTLQRESCRSKFGCSLWASIREAVFDEVADSWEEQGKEGKYGPYKGRFANSLAIYPETLNLKLKNVVQPVGVRPLFFLEDNEHALAVQQRSGISQEQAVELASFLLHSEGRPYARS